MRKKMVMVMLCCLLIGSVQAVIPELQEFDGNPGDPLPGTWMDLYANNDYNGIGGIDWASNGVNATYFMYTPDIGFGDFSMQVNFTDVLLTPGWADGPDQGMTIEMYATETNLLTVALQAGWTGETNVLRYVIETTLSPDPAKTDPGETGYSAVEMPYTAATIGSIEAVDFNITWVEDTPGGTGVYRVDIVLNPGLPSEDTYSRSFASDAITGRTYPGYAHQVNIIGSSYDGNLGGAAPFVCTLDRFFVNSSLRAAFPVSPANGATYVDKSTESLVWNAPAAAYTPSGYNLYVRADDPNFPAGGNAIEITNGSAASPYALSSLDFGTTYYWRVDALEPNGVSTDVHEGGVLSFSITPEAPHIVTQPEGQVRGPANGKLDSSITIEGINGEGYQWYKDGAPVAGQTTDTLAITGVTLGDEGGYYCVVTHSVLADATSDIAYLEYARLTGQWDFENNLNDTAGTNNGTWSSGAAAYGTGIVGSKAIDFGTGDPESVTVPVAAVPANGKEMSVSLWAKNGPMHGSGLIPFAVVDSAGDPVFLAATPWGGGVVFNTGDPISPDYNSIGYVVSNVDLEDVWNHWVFTCDSEDGYMAIYRNGEMVAEYSGALSNDILGAVSFDIGSQANAITSYYQGMLDDFRVYNYAIDAVEAAYLYTDVKTGETVCAGDAGVFDVTGPGDEPDCRVDILDFAAFAGDWLDCNQVPDCLPRP